MAESSNPQIVDDDETEFLTSTGSNDDQNDRSRLHQIERVLSDKLEKVTARVQAFFDSFAEKLVNVQSKVHQFDKITQDLTQKVEAINNQNNSPNQFERVNRETGQNQPLCSNHRLAQPMLAANRESNFSHDHSYSRNKPLT
ncbi:hypothetical protein DPMN_146863 [Dreissena polymorpha]|uniref:Uncharacterized protein n=1 Tax=Dreissena polymorpha TaxID=45954 RepID=A0A9D4J038_DREPO|nr:hypothetical protein DPMN_146863 [Dreissena polymorpha]